MPPQRTIPPAKAVKTERTHEENQERAYIAASRRSDRSLEARVESARRASEIHKRRTGRSLRVTEQDVVNEEMYEEEDDDLPMQYRRLTAHLQTGSVDFNRRLHAYLTNHVAMRSALDQAITNTYAAQYPNAPQFAHNQSMFPSPMTPGQMMPPTSPSVYRTAPYPIPGAQAHQISHARASSIANPQMNTCSGFRSAFDHTFESPPKSPPTDRRSSMPAVTGTAASTNPPSPSNSSRPTLDTTSSFQSDAAGRAETPSQQFQANPMQQNSTQFDMSPLQGGFSPFTTSLPMESQMMLGPALDPNDPFTAQLMAGSNGLPQYPLFNDMPSLKQGMFHSSYDGMNATLAPSALDLSSQDFADKSTMKDPEFSRENTGGTNGSAFDGDWNAFIDDNSWDQNIT